VAKIAVYNLPERELEDNERINTVARAVIGATLSIPGTGLKEEDISSFTFPRDFLKKPGKVSVVITGASFFKKKVNSQVRRVLRRRVIGSLQLILGIETENISVEIKRPEPE